MLTKPIDTKSKLYIYITLKVTFTLENRKGQPAIIRKGRICNCKDREDTKGYEFVYKLQQRQKDKVQFSCCVKKDRAYFRALKVLI